MDSLGFLDFLHTLAAIITCRYRIMVFIEDSSIKVRTYWPKIDPSIFFWELFVNSFTIVYESRRQWILISAVQIPTDLVTFNEEILNGKLHILCSVCSLVPFAASSLVSVSPVCLFSWETQPIILASGSTALENTRILSGILND